MSKKKAVVIVCVSVVAVLALVFGLIFVEPGICLDCKKLLFEEPDYKYSAYGDVYCNACAENHKNCDKCGKEILVSYDDYCNECLVTAKTED